MYEKNIILLPSEMFLFLYVWVLAIKLKQNSFMCLESSNFPDSLHP